MKVSDYGPAGGGGGGGSAVQLYAGALPGAAGAAVLGTGPAPAGWVLDYRIQVDAGYGAGSTVTLSVGATTVKVMSAELPIQTCGPVWIPIAAGAVVATIAGATLAGSGTAGVLAG